MSWRYGKRLWDDHSELNISNIVVKISIFHLQALVYDKYGLIGRW